MNIIIEGPDNGGKSSLIERLQPALKRTIIHNTVDKDAQSVLAKQSAEVSREGNILYDRSAVISEYIYCMVLSRAPVIDIDMASIFEIARNSVLVICLPSKEAVCGTSKDEMEGVKENIERLYDAYDRLVDFLAIEGVPFFIYNWQADSVDDVIGYINKRNELEWKK